MARLEGKGMGIPTPHNATLYSDPQLGATKPMGHLITSLKYFA